MDPVIGYTERVREYSGGDSSSITLERILEAKKLVERELREVEIPEIPSFQSLLGYEAQGVRIIESPYLTERETWQSFIPRSKKKRIRKKCAKKYTRTREVPSKSVVQLNAFNRGIWICHPEVAKKLKEVCGGVT